MKLTVKDFVCPVCNDKLWIREGKDYTRCYKCYPEEGTRSSEHKQLKQASNMIISYLLEQNKLKNKKS